MLPFTSNVATFGLQYNNGQPADVLRYFSCTLPCVTSCASQIHLCAVMKRGYRLSCCSFGQHPDLERGCAPEGSKHGLSLVALSLSKYSSISASLPNSASVRNNGYVKLASAVLPRGMRRMKPRERETRDGRRGFCKSARRYSKMRAASRYNSARAVRSGVIGRSIFGEVS